MAVLTVQSASSDGQSYGVIAARKYIAVEASLGLATIQGVDPSVFSISVTNLVFRMNRTSVATGRVLDWSQAAVSAAQLDISPSDPVLQVGGTLSLGIGGVVQVSGNFGYTRTTDTANNRTLIKIGVTEAKGTAGSDEFGLTGGHLDWSSSRTPPREPRWATPWTAN